MKRSFFNQIRHKLTQLVAVFSLVTLTACGGGGGGSDNLVGAPSDGGSTTTPITPPGAPSAINFESAEPTTLALQGVAQAGLTQSSVVKFSVVDAAGTPTPSIQVNFSLTTTLGGITLSTPSTVTDSTGTATVTVTSGTVATPVSVVAVVDRTNYRAQSSELNISTGVADQNSFSISVGTFNPEGQDFDGVTSEITARLADRFNNPVPDGTVVQFTTSAGSIEPRCSTDKGACSVKWTSQNPRDQLGTTTETLGMFAILAFAVGEESFDDTNSNGRFDSADSFDLGSQDIPEPWLDSNFDGIYNQGEVFRDFNGDGIWNDKNGLFNGWLCDDPTRCASSPSLFISSSVKLVMADSDASIPNIPPEIKLTSTSTTKDTATHTVKIIGMNSLILPADTTIAITTTHGTIKDGGSYSVPNTTESGLYRTDFRFTIEGKGESGSGNVKITVTTPKGTVSIFEIPVSEQVQ